MTEIADPVAHNGRRVLKHTEPTTTIRVFLHGYNYAGTLDEEIVMSAFGEGCVASLARRLLVFGHSPDTQLEVRRGGHIVGRLALRDAARSKD
jgi:hypothetical protein